METIKIGELARRAGVNIQTVRYYERRGLLPEPERRASGYREYGAECLARLQFIRRAQELGFTLAEIDALLALRTEPGTTAEDVRARATEKIADIDARIADLRRIRKALAHLVGECRAGAGPTGDCPLLAAMGPLEGGCADHGGQGHPERSGIIMRRSIGRGLSLLALVVAGTFVGAGRAWAHCDGMDGPVVKAAGEHATAGEAH